MHPRLRAPSALLLLCLAGADAVHAQSAENVAVVINENSETSKRIGEYYAAKRRIPPSNVLRISTSTAETIERPVYAATIENPIAIALAREGLQDRVLYIVLTKGVPLKIAGTAGRAGTAAGVDSELALLYRRMTGSGVVVRGRVDNPYFLGTRSTSEAAAFTHRDHDIFLVTRLDAFTEREAMALVDRALAPVSDGRIVLDQRAALTNRRPEEWLAAAATRLAGEGHGERVVLETTPKPARGVEEVLGYYSWGSVDPQNRVRRVELGFVPGSIAATFVSDDGRTFEEPPQTWVPDPVTTNPSSRFAGSAGSLAGDLIREGVTGIAAHVNEPLLDSVVRPEVLFPAYLAGFNLAEAFYLAMPHLGWQTVVVGDPLCAPLARTRLTRKEIEGGIDSATGLPALFAARRLKQAAAAAPGAPDRAVALAVRAEAMVTRNDQAEARRALAAAVELAPDVAPWQLQLALMDEAAGEYDAAMARYERVLAIDPKQVIALNNLAYGLAVRKKDPNAALPLAKRAVALAPENGVMLDTLGWIEHLLGNHEAATKLMAQAIARAPGNAEVRLHAAFVFAAVNTPGVAEAELNAALKLNPALADRADVKELRASLDGRK